MATKKEMVIEQIEMMNTIREKSNINIVNCGNCGTILLHEMDKKDTIKCFECKEEMAKSDCPDYWYEGCQNDVEFNDD